MKYCFILILLGSLFFLSCSEDSDSEVLTYTASITTSDNSLPENQGSATVTVTLDNVNQGNVIPFQRNVSGTATADEDYSISGPSEIQNGSSSASFTVTIIDDQEVENDETVEISLAFESFTDLNIRSNETLVLAIVDNDTEPDPPTDDDPNPDPPSGDDPNPDDPPVDDDPDPDPPVDDDPTTGPCADVTDSYAIDLDATGCMESAEANLGVNSVYSVAVSGNDRIITSNGIPDHNVGMFPNGGNPNTISVQDKTFVITANPSKSNNTTSLTTSNGQPRYWFGILDNSVILAPIANEFFTNTSTGEDNRDWNENALSSNITLGTDCNNAHVFPTGRYHHHATPSAYVADRNISSSATTQVGWAADGFPIYYKYGNKDGSVAELAASFRLKTTERGGDDVSAPAGCPDGTYVEDYEYVEGLGDLDECNGYEDPVLGYIYVITDTYPSIPRCFYGSPSEDFSNN